MNSYQPIVIHKSVWDRLKRQTGPQEEPVKQNDEYIKGLMEKSQAWIKKWPDSVEGHMKKLREQKKKQHEQDMALIRANAKNKVKTYRADAVKKAKQLIFEDSCYGNQLISALVESKTLEERDLQIQFQKKLKQRNIEQEKSTRTPSLYCSFNLDKNHDKREEQNKLRALECYNENKCMQLHKEKSIKETEMENLFNKQDTQKMDELLMKETQLEDKAKKSHQVSVTEYEIVQQKIKEDRNKCSELDDALIKIYQKEQEKRKCKIRQVLNKIHKDNQDTALHKHVYKIIEDSQEIQNKRYQFIDDRIQSVEQQQIMKDLNDVDKANHDRKKLKEIYEYNKNVHKNEQRKYQCAAKCVCDKQCLIPPASKDGKHVKTVSCATPEKDRSGLNFLKPHKKLVDELRKRQKIPSAWSGTSAAHKQFATVASEIIQECKYKNLARQVVDQYRKLHQLDSTSLPVPNY